MSEPIMWIDDWIEELSTERQLICAQRAAIAIGLPVTLNPDRTVTLPELTEEGKEALEQALHVEFKHMHAADLLAEMAEDGLIESNGVDEDGEIIYVAC